MKVKTLRYYDDIGLVRTQRTASGYRSYSQKQLAQLYFVKRARAYGFSLDNCRELLALQANQSRDSGQVKQIAKQRIEQMEITLQELQSLHTELKTMVHACKGDDKPECPILDGLGSNKATN